MSTYRLYKIFKPACIAVVGASDAPGSIGGAVLRNLQAGGFWGDVVPINPKYERIGGLPVLKPIESL